MSALLANVIPILFLIAFGYMLRRKNYFSDEALQRLTGLVANIFVPCVIFNTILNLEIRTEHVALTIGFFCFQVLLLALSYGIYRLFRIGRRFFIFYHCAFSFGFMAMPLFSTVFGAENMGYLVSMGIGQEIFVALVFITAAKMMLKGEAFSGKRLIRDLFSPLFCMILAALLLKFTGLKEIFEANVVGNGLLRAIAQLGSMTSVLTMLVVGYRIHFRNKRHIGESFAYVGARYAMTFGLGYAIKFLIFDRIVSPNPYYDYAFFTLLSQHGSVLLTIFVGEYGSREDMEISSNAFVINVLVGIILYVGFIYRLGLA